MTQAKSVKEVLLAIKWMYQNKLELSKSNYFRNQKREALSVYACRQGEIVPFAACLSGCLMLVDATNLARAETSALLTSLVPPNINGLAPIPSWNDHLDRTKQDVIGLLDQALQKV